MASPYTFVSANFPNGLDIRRFGVEVSNDSTIGSLYQWCRQSGSPYQLLVKFSRALTSPEEAALFALVAAHDPTVAPQPGHLLAELQAKQPGVSAGTVAYARDARKNGDPPGNGTGLLVYSDGTQWLEASSDQAPTT